MGHYVYELIKDLIINRYPINVRISATGIDLPAVSVSIVNKTPTLAVHVHAVRIHYGTKVLPAEKVTLPPKEKGDWILSFDTAILTERRIRKEAPRAINPNSQPGIESPAKLFNAIGMGKKKDSWVEIDFNEYSNWKFLKSRVKGIFDAVGKLHCEIRKRKRAEQGGI